MKVVGDGFVLGGVEGLDLGNDFFFLGVLMDLGDVMDSGWTGAGVGVQEAAEAVGDHELAGAVVPGKRGL